MRGTRERAAGAKRGGRSPAAARRCQAACRGRWEGGRAARPAPRASRPRSRWPLSLLSLFSPAVHPGALADGRGMQRSAAGAPRPSYHLPCNSWRGNWACKLSGHCMQAFKEPMRALIGGTSYPAPTLLPALPPPPCSRHRRQASAHHSAFHAEHQLYARWTCMQLSHGCCGAAYRGPVSAEALCVVAVVPAAARVLALWAWHPT